MSLHVPVERPVENFVDGSAFACPFCDIGRNRPGDSEVMIIEPLNPVTPGHLLFVPRAHFRDASANPDLAARVFFVACCALRDGLYGVSHGEANLITSIGRAATQTVMHYHLHLVPRTLGDGLALPWTLRAG